MSLLFSNCKLFTHLGRVNGDVLVGEDGKIAKIGHNLASDETINLHGKLLLPGLIDPHVHLRDPGQTYKEDFYTGTCAALAGGVTTILDMPNNSPPIISQQRLNEKNSVAKTKAVCDYGFHIGATDSNALEAQNSNAVAMKLYMGSTTGDLLVENENSLQNIFSTFKRTIVVHAEDNKCIKEASVAVYHAAENHNKMRPPLCAEISLKKAIDLTKKHSAKLHVAHMSTGGEVELVKQAKKSGLRVSCEVTPQHLFLTEEATREKGNFARLNPPLRSKSDQQALWANLSSVDCIATDHAPHTIEEKQKPYDEAPSGLPGLETTLPLLLDAFSRKRISLEEIVRLTSFGTSQVFGLVGKAQLAVGFDADFVVVDLEKETRVENGDLWTKCNWSPFDGMKLKGQVVQTFLRGNEVFDGENICVKQGSGKNVNWK
ncbi:MAG: dihydroorotase family protein [Candidatus Micrarchaeota archaeon]|nr:dihydroorotase family protein [Candidatus Micrarchaeota archaeon]